MMPLFPEGEDPRTSAQFSERAPLGQPQPDPFAGPTNSDAIDAAFRLNNPVVSVFNALGRSDPSYQRDPNHNPFETIKGTKYEAEHGDDFIGSPNEAYTRSIMGKIDNEDKLRQTLASSGTVGQVASIAASLLDPTFYIPIVGEVAGARGAGGALMAAGRMAAGGAVQSIASEAVLHATQQTRSTSESVFNVASNTLLMGILGGAMSQFSHGESAALTKSFEADRRKLSDLPPERPKLAEAPALADADLTKKLVDQPPEVQAAVAAHLEETKSPLKPEGMTLQQIVDAEPTPPAGGVNANAVGAASSDPRTLEGLTPKSYYLERLPVIGEWFKGTNPIQRVLWQQTSVSAKRAIADMSENALRLKMNAEGIATASDVPISRLITTEKNRFFLQATEDLKSAFVEYRYGANPPKAAELRAGLEDLRGQNGDKMTYAEFKHEVSRALYNADTHENPFVDKVAKSIRTNVLDPIKERAVTAGLLDKEAVAPKGDASFFHRVYSKEAIAAKRNDFHNRITQWLMGEQDIKAAIKDRLQAHSDNYEGLTGDIDKLESRLESLQSKIKDTGVRLSEREMEAKRADRRASTVAERAGEVNSAISELQEFIANARTELRDPASQQRLEGLEKELAGLQNEAKPISEAEMARLNRADVEEVLPGEWRKAAQVVLGTRRKPEGQSFVSHLVKDGGVNDRGGDVRQALGGPRARPGLLSQRGRTLDQWGERFYEMAPEAFPNGRPTEAEVSDIISGALRGDEPSWWREHSMPKEHLQRAEMADYLSEVLDAGGHSPTNLREVAKALMDEAGKNPRVLERLQEKASAASQVPGAEAAVEGRQSAFADLQDVIQRGLKARAGREQAASVAGARASEAGMAASANRGRLGILQDRASTQEAVRDIYQRAIDVIEAKRQDARTAMEKELEGWQGKSSGEALAAIKERNAAEATRQADIAAGTYKGRGNRLAGADTPVSRAVKRIIESDRDLSPQDLAGRANEIIDRILGSPDGRLPYDAPSGGPKMGVGNEPPPRGALHSREFAIPTNLISDYVEHDVEHVLQTFLRTTLPDIALHEKYGDVEMKDVFRKINEEYSAKASTLKGEKALTALEKERQGVVRDVAAMRDKIRNVYGWTDSTGARKLGQLARTARNFNSTTDLGTAMLNSMGDLAGGVFRYGFNSAFNDAWKPYFQSLLGLESLAGKSKQQAKDLMISIETLTNLRNHSVNDVLEGYKPGSKFERGLQWSADKMQLLNGQSWFTDRTKSMATSMAQAEMLRATERVAGGKATARDIEWLASNSIDPGMATRIWEEFKKPGGGDTIDGTHLANTDQWSNRQAARMFEGALQREVDIAVVTPGHEKPLWMSDPIWGLFGQFKAFVAATHERTLVAQLQQMDGRTAQGAIAAVALGMLSYRLYTAVAGQAVSDRPQDWVKEGISRSGVTGWLEEINSIGAKATRGQSDMYRVIGADKPLSRYASRSLLSSFLGPTAGKIEGLGGAVGSASVGAAKMMGADVDGGWSSADTNAVKNLIPFRSLFYLRNAMDATASGVNDAFGIPNKHP